MAGKDFTVQIVKRIGVIRELDNGWARELNIVSWNGADPKYDVREWSPDHERMSRGITLTSEEMSSLCTLYVTNLDTSEKVMKENEQHE